MGRFFLRTAPLALALYGLGACGGAARQGDDGVSAEAVRAYTEAGLLAEHGRWDESATRFDEAAALQNDVSVVWLAAARARARLADWPAAVERAEKAVVLAPEEPEPVRFLANAYVEAGNPDAAKRTYQDFLAGHEDDAGTWWRYGALLARIGDLEAAEQALTKSVTADPTQVDAWERLGVTRTRLRQPAAAAAAYDKAVGLDEKRAYLNQAVLQLALDGGDLELVRAAAIRIAKGDRKAATLAVASLLIKRDDLLSAANELEALLLVEPDEHRARLMLATILISVGRVDQAQGVMLPVPSTGTIGQRAVRLRAEIAVLKKEFDEAIRLLSEARQSDPDDVQLSLMLANVFRRQKALDKALGLLDQAQQAWPDNNDVPYLRGLILQEAGKEEQALGVMQTIVERDENHAGALNFVGYTWAESGERLEEAEALIRRAVAIEPADGAIQDSLGWVLFRRGQLDEAQSTLQKAAKLSPDVAEIRLHLAEVLLAAGRRQEALDAFRESVRLAAGTELEETYKRRFDAVRKKTR